MLQKDETEHTMSPILFHNYTLLPRKLLLIPSELLEHFSDI